MDILKRSLAPVSDQAWDQIEEQAREIFNAFLSARKFVDVEGPKGWDYAAVSTGRIYTPENQSENVKYGIKQVSPLIEARVSFKLDLWELDNIARGAEDVELEAMEKAAIDIAKFEENAIYYGFEPSQIKGLKESSEHKAMKYPQNNDEAPSVFARGINELKNATVEGPYSLVIGAEKWQSLTAFTKGYPMKKQIEDLIGGSIIVSQNISEAFLVSERSGDFRLTLGTDLSIGYESHNGKEVQLFFTESFVFQIFDPSAVIIFD
ncbi:bacteriocin [candidate division KSB1 bacterium]|nr:bacteriocin [candidate division KSB1 bacterium]